MGVEHGDGLTAAALAAARRRLRPPADPAPVTVTALPVLPGARVVVVAGPGVLVANLRRELATFARITGATVVNTVGAKGLLRWDDPLHGGTIGLQTDDADLAEVSTADLVVTTGYDPTESLSLTAAVVARRAAEPDAVVDVHPVHLVSAVADWPSAVGPSPRPPIYDRIAAVVGPMYSAEPDERGAVPPPAAAAALARSLSPGGLVVALPGPTGFWVGRTFPTTEPGSVIVPTGDPPATAEAVAFLSARSDRPTTLVVADTSDLLEPISSEARAGGHLTVERWTSETEVGSPPTAPWRVVTVDWSAIDPLVAVAGSPDPAAWPGNDHLELSPSR